MTILALLTRITITIAFLWLVMRLTGKRGWVQTRPLDLLLAFLLGNIGYVMSLGQTTVVEALIAIGLLVWLHLLVTFLMQRSAKLRTLLWGHPVTLLRNGVPQRTTLHRMGLTAIHLDALLRAQGIDRMRDVRELTVEPDGSILLRRHADAMPLTRNELSATAEPQEDEPWPRAA